MSLPPKLWGGSVWRFLHFAVLTYPLYPTNTDKENISNVINALPGLLPCKQCRIHLKENLEKTPLTDDVLSIKLKLIMWLHHLHNMVNKITGSEILSFETAMVRLFTDSYECDNEHDNAEHDNREHDNHEHNNYNKLPSFTQENMIRFYKTMQVTNKTINDTEVIDNNEKDVDDEKGVNEKDDDEKEINVVNIESIYEKYQKGIDARKKLNEEVKKGKASYMNSIGDEKALEIKKNEEIMKKKIADLFKKGVASMRINNDVKPQETIDIDLLIKNFVEAVEKESNPIKKEGLMNALQLLLAIF